MHNKCMDIEFDLDKDRINQEKHGVSLAEVENLEWETLWAFEDNRKDYGEVRIIGFAYIGNRLYSVVYTHRETSIRIISLRKANSREVRRYAEA